MLKRERGGDGEQAQVWHGCAARRVAMPEPGPGRALVVACRGGRRGGRGAGPRVHGEGEGRSTCSGGCWCGTYD